MSRRPAHQRRAASHDAETARAVSRHFGLNARSLIAMAVVFRGTLEGNLELAWQRRAETMPQEKARDGVRYGVTSNTSSVDVPANGHAADVAHRVAVSLRAVMPTSARRRIACSGVVEPDEVQLDVLTRGDVTGTGVNTCPPHPQARRAVRR